MARTLQVLLVSSSAELADELNAALEAATDLRVTLRRARDFAEAGEAARARLPDLVCTELGGDAAALGGFVTALRALALDLPFVGVTERRSGEGRDEKEVLVEALRTGFLDAFERPISSADVRRVLPQVLAVANARETAGHVVVFHSTKGGVGKSTLSVNTACGLAQRMPDRVLLVDASLQLGVCAIALDLEPRTTLADAARERERLDERLLRELAERHSSGLRVLASPRDPIDAADVNDEALARVLAIGRRAFDFVVVDTLPVVDSAMLTLLDSADRIFLVNQGTVPDVIGAERLLQTLDQLDIGTQRRRVVLNRNTPRFSGALTAAEVGERLGQEIDYEVPHDKRVLTGLNLGEPLALRAGSRFGWGRVIRQMVDDVIALAGPTPPASPEVEEAKARQPEWRTADADA